MAKINVDRRTKVILASSIILMLCYFIIGRVTVSGSKNLLVFSFIAPIFGEIADVYQYVFQFFAAFIFLFIIPMIIVKYILKEEFSRHGLQAGEVRFGLVMFALGVAILVPAMFFSASMPEVHAEYPLSKLISRSLVVLVLYEASYLFYYISWEFFFRGYLQLGLVSERTTKLGIFLALLYQSFFSTIMHVGKPAGEILGAAAIGPIFGWVSLRSKSVVYLIGIHYIIGVTTDISCLILLGRL